MAPPPSIEREKQLETRLDHLFAMLGWQTIRFSQARETKQTPGIPDRRYRWPALPAIALWFEVKTLDNTLSPAQAFFRQQEILAGQIVLVGGLEEAEAYLRDGRVDFLEGREYGYHASLRKWYSQAAIALQGPMSTSTAAVFGALGDSRPGDPLPRLLQGQAHQEGARVEAPGIGTLELRGSRWYPVKAVAR